MAMNDIINMLWTTDNKDTIFNMIAMYALNSRKKGWWDHVNVILWGASVKLAASDTSVQTEIAEMIRAGIHVEACEDCCNNFGVKAVMQKMGIDVKYMGQHLTDRLKRGEKVITI